jgi:DNA-binding response OmpR family regulator
LQLNSDCKHDNGLRLTKTLTRNWLKARIFETAMNVRFGAFEVDLEGRRLLKRGMPITLREQSFQVLAALMEHPARSLPGKSCAGGSGHLTHSWISKLR